MKYVYMLVKFEYVSGEFEFGSSLIFKMEESQDLDEALHEFFMDFWSDPEPEDPGRFYLYCGGQVGVKIRSSQEISKDVADILNSYTSNIHVIHKKKEGE